MYLNGHGIPDLDVRGQRVTDDSFVLCFNAHYEPIDFMLPTEEFGAAWVPVIYTAAEAARSVQAHEAGAKVTVRRPGGHGAASRRVTRSLDDVEERVAVLRRPVDLATFAPVLLRIEVVEFVVGGRHHLVV